MELGGGEKTGIWARMMPAIPATNHWIVPGGSLEIKAGIICQIKQHSPGMHATAAYEWIEEKSIQIVSYCTPEHFSACRCWQVTSGAYAK